MEEKIALINCPMWDIEFPPYNIALLAAVLKKHDRDVTCFDFNRELYSLAEDDKNLWGLIDPYSFWQSKARIRELFISKETLINDFVDNLRPYNILGFTVQSLNFTFTIEIAGIVKKRFPDKLIIVGGPECFRNFNPEHLIASGCFDALCCGEGEDALPELITKVIGKRGLHTPGFFVKNATDYTDCGNRDLLQDLNCLPFADYSFLDKGTKNVSISTSRGCICHCSFCHEKCHWDRYRCRNAESVVEELSALKKQFPLFDFAYFDDSLINGNLAELSKFCELMIQKELGIHWGGHALIRKEMTRDFLKKMKLAGAQRLNFGIESGSDNVLRLMRKSFNRDLALRVLEGIKETGISFSVNFIIGYPGETEEDFSMTQDLYRRIKQLTDCIHINPCLILKGSLLYKDSKKLGIVLSQNYVTDWFLADGSNNLELRLSRIRDLKVS